MRVFVTGGGGFIGSHLCEALRDAGHDVTAMSHYRSQDSYGWLDEVEGVRKVRGDIRDQNQMTNLIGADVEAVYHLAALGSVPYSYIAPQSFVETNVSGTLNVLAACASRNSGIKFIHMSTSEVYGTAQYEPQDEKHPINPQSPYAASKVAADALVTSFAATYGMDCTIMRPFNTFGPRQSERALLPTIIRQFLDPNCELVRLGIASARRDLTYVKDTVSRMIMNAAVDELGPFNIGTGWSHSVEDVAKDVAKILGSKKPVEYGSSERQRPQSSEVLNLCAEPESHNIGYERGLLKTIDWWRSRPFRSEVGNVV